MHANSYFSYAKSINAPAGFFFLDWTNYAENGELLVVISQLVSGLKSIITICRQLLFGFISNWIDFIFSRPTCCFFMQASPHSHCHCQDHKGPATLYAGGIWKLRYITTVRPTAHTNSSRKRSFSKTLFKAEFENAGFSFSRRQKTFWNRSILKTMTSR